MTEHLDKELKALVEIEAIKKLKAKYWRCCDRKLWDELAECFTDNAVANYSSRCEGKAAILQLIQRSLGPRTILSTHRGHNPEIELTGANTAKGIWALYDYIVDTQANTSRAGWAYYEDEYSKEAGKWQITSSTIVRIFWEKTAKEITSSM